MLSQSEHRQDYATAAKWYRAAAVQGWVPAQYELALLYISGLGVPADKAEAYAWFQAAGNRGNDKGQQTAKALRASFNSLEYQAGQNKLVEILNSIHDPRYYGSCGWRGIIL